MALTGQWRDYIAIGFLIFAGDQAAAQTPTPSPQATPSSAADIVVTGRRAKKIDPKDVTDTIPPQTIKSYATDSIGDLLNRLSARFGRNFSVLVNGRRLATVDAINALPPEALEGIEILTTAKGREFGFPSGDRVINLALRPRFQFATLEAGASTTTEGGGDAENGAVRYSRIRNDNRLNVALAYNRQGGLLESGRIRPDDSDPSGAYRSLVPRQDATTLTAGYARPLGSLNLDLSAELNVNRSSAKTGLIKEGSNDPSSLLRASNQLIGAQSIRSGATISGNAGPYFWSLLVNGELAWTSTKNRTGQRVQEQNTIQQAVLGPDVSARSTSYGATFTSAGPLFTIPAGAVTLDGTASIRRNILQSRGASAASLISNSYIASTAQGGVTIPLVRKGGGVLGFMGDLTFAQRFDYARNSGIGESFAATSSLDWNPLPQLQFSMSRSSSPGLPGATVLFAPIVKRPGVPIYDAISGMVVPVTIISGGRGDIEQSKSTATSLQATYQGRLPFAMVSTTINYAESQTLDPLVSFSNPSPLAQRLLPDLFVRDSDGRIAEFDSRPFSGRDETIRQLGFSIHLNGPAPKAASASDSTDILVAPALPRGPAWDINLSYSYALSHRLNLGNGSEVDLLSTPLSLSGSGSARHRLNVQGTIGTGNFGLNGSISWDSGSRVQALDDNNGVPISFSAVTRVGLEAFVELDKSPDPANPKSLRLKLAVDNLFNDRLRVSGYTGLNDASQRLLTDPYGRIIRITLRKSL